MRYVMMLAVMVMTVGLATPSLAATETKQISSTPSFDDCYRLAWVRGVHVERGELPDFDEQCMANQVPFNSGMAVDSIRRSSN